jgi:hypothetical protein
MEWNLRSELIGLIYPLRQPEGLLVPLDEGDKRSDAGSCQVANFFWEFNGN